MSDGVRTTPGLASDSPVARVVAALVGNYRDLLTFAEHHAGSRAAAEALLLRAFVVAVYDAGASTSGEANAITRAPGQAGTDESAPSEVLLMQLRRLLGEALVVQRAQGAATVVGSLSSSAPRRLRQCSLPRRLRPRGPARGAGRRGFRGPTPRG